MKTNDIRDMSQEELLESLAELRLTRKAGYERKPRGAKNPLKNLPPEIVDKLNKLLDELEGEKE